jgi:hypothetical protein
VGERTVRILMLVVVALVVVALVYSSVRFAF